MNGNLTGADAQNDLAQNMTLREALMRPRCFAQLEALRNRDLQLRALDGAGEALELPHPGLAVVCRELQPATLLRRRLDSIRMRHSCALAQRIETARERLAADEGEDRVDATRREGARRGCNVFALAIDHSISAEAAHECRAVGAGRAAEAIGAAQLRELHP